MNSLLLLRHIRVTNANAIAGLTYGFPSITSFLGFTHNLSRALYSKLRITLGGCAVICHKHQIHAHQPGGWGDYVFSLTRNPLTKDSASPPFVEEGRMHMDISLVIECNFMIEDIRITDEQGEIKTVFENIVRDQVMILRMAGGAIESIGKVEFRELPEDRKEYDIFMRHNLLRLLPGFALVDGSDLMRKHHQERASINQESEMIDSWLDFFTIRHRSEPIQEEDLVDSEAPKASWKLNPRPGSGYLVPLAIGYKSISPLYQPGQVARSRDDRYPLSFVESVYGVGQWISPHRIKRLDELMWRYESTGEWYICRNDFLQGS